MPPQACPELVEGDFRRVAARYDKLAANFLSGVALATAIAFWLSKSFDPRTRSQMT